MHLTYEVQTPKFKGPLELLLDLIEKRKLSISDVSLSEVTDSFIEHLKSLPNKPIIGMAQFVVVASTLLLIKSISIVPSLSLTNEEEQSIEELEFRLKEYKRMKELSHYVDEKFGKQLIMWREEHKRENVEFFPHENITSENLKSILAECLSALPGNEEMRETAIEKVKSLPEMIEDLTNRIQDSVSLSFNEFVGHKRERALDREGKLGLILSFLALLELLKQEVITAMQGDNFHDIDIKIV